MLIGCRANIHCGWVILFDVRSALGHVNIANAIRPNRTYPNIGVPVAKQVLLCIHHEPYANRVAVANLRSVLSHPLCRSRTETSTHLSIGRPLAGTSIVAHTNAAKRSTIPLSRRAIAVRKSIVAHHLRTRWCGVCSHTARISSAYHLD